MSFWTAATIIVVIGSATGIVMQYLKGREGATASDEKVQALRDENAELRKRIETLEAIVTDGRESLKRQFEDLER